MRLPNTPLKLTAAGFRCARVAALDTNRGSITRGRSLAAIRWAALIRRHRRGKRIPVVFTFDIQGAAPVEHNRLQSLFERLGWQNLGGSSYRYPRLGADQPTEDWFNHVIPALMLFRSYIRSSGRQLSKYTLDIQASTGLNPATGYGTGPGAANAVTLYAPANQAFGEQNLRTWLDGVTYPY